MNYLDLKYVRLVSGYLSHWKEVGKDLYRFRCPFCGDSKKTQSKTRGYFFSLDDSAVFKCHNCGASYGLTSFLSEVAPSLAGDYKLEKFKDSRKFKQTKAPEEEKYVTTTAQRLRRTGTILEGCQRIMSLPEDHHAREYLDNRKIPSFHQSKLFYVPNVEAMAECIPGYADRNIPNKDAIVIPFFDEDSCLMYLQCRFFDEKFRYMTFEVEEEGKKLWGLDRIDWSKRVYVCEGPFDAMFIDNCIAVAGASITSELKYFRERSKNELVLIFDKDYRVNPEVYALLEQAVDAGHKVVLFDSSFNGKDINDQILAGMDQKDLMVYLGRRTFSGLMAKLELSKFRAPKKRKYDSNQKEKERFRSTG